MGCGTSKQGAQATVVDEQVDEALVSHLANVLKVPKDVAIIKQYAAVLRLEGWDTPEVCHGVHRLPLPLRFWTLLLHLPPMMLFFDIALNLRHPIPSPQPPLLRPRLLKS